MNENSLRYCVSIRDTFCDSEPVELYFLNKTGLELLFKDIVDDFNSIDSSSFSCFADYLDALDRSFSRIISIGRLLKEDDNVQDTVPTQSDDC